METKNKEFINLLTKNEIWRNCCSEEAYTNLDESNTVMKFKFGNGINQYRYKLVGKLNTYCEELGYGFIDKVDNSLDDIKETTSCSYEGYYISDKSVNFRIDIPNGIYDITVITGECKEDTAITVKADGILKIQDSKVAAGRIEKKTFLVGVYNGKIDLEFIGASAKICGLEIAKKPLRNSKKYPRILIAGDSTVQSYTEREYPQSGWGEMIGKYIKPEIKIINRAIGGRSTRNFTFEGRFDIVLAEARPRDYIFIQFGHNDAAKENADRYAEAGTTYKDNLRKYIDGARTRKAIPVLVTPMGRRSYDENNVFYHNFTEYINAMKQVAEEKDTPLIDLAERSIDYYNTLGPEETKKVFLWTEPGESQKFVDGAKDDTHFRIYGAYQIARLISEEIKIKVPELADYILQEAISKSLAAKPADANTIKSFPIIPRDFEKEAYERMKLCEMTIEDEEEFKDLNKNITRIEFLTLLSKVMNLGPASYKNIYEDISDEDWYSNIVQAAAEVGIINDNMTPCNKFNPNEFITREEMFSLITGAYRHYFKVHHVPGQAVDFSDAKELSEWAINEVKAAYFYGMVKGDTKATFSPKGEVSIAEAVVMIYELCDLIK